jgi:hypothetical protein
MIYFLATFNFLFLFFFILFVFFVYFVVQTFKTRIPGSPPRNFHFSHKGTLKLHNGTKRK